MCASALGTVLRSCASISGPGSTAITRPTRPTKARVSFPVPAPRSRTVDDVSTPSCAASQTTASSGYSGRTRSYRSATSSKLRDWGCCSSDTRGGAEIGQDTILAPRHARDAHAAPVPDQQVRKAPPVLARHEPDQVALDLDRVLLSRQAQALGEPADVRVDDDPLRAAELGGDDVRSFPRHPGKPHELVEPARHLSVELLEQHLHRSAQRLRLLAVEAGREDVALELLRRDGEVVLGPAVLDEQLLCDSVDVHVRRL